MYCQNCGAKCTDSYCPKCGEPVKNLTQQTSFYYQTTSQQNSQNTQALLSYQNPMKWYKFLIYFLLFADAAWNIYGGIINLTGLRYGTRTELVYHYYPVLKGIDVLLGIANFIFAAFAIYTRYRLANYCKNGPRSLTNLYLWSIYSNIVYTFFLCAIVSTGTTTLPSLIGNVVGTVVMVILNRKYFNNRKDLFIH